MLISEQKGRISALYKSRHARASKPPLARHSQTPARASTIPLERRIHTSRTFAEPGLRSSVTPPARASHITTHSSVKTPARAYNSAEEILEDGKLRSSVKNPARASKSPLEREGQNLGNYSWFLSSTNLFQIRPTQTKTRMQGVKDVNKTYTTTNSTEPKSGYNS